jgi:hypothetical protein
MTARPIINKKKDRPASQTGLIVGNDISLDEYVRLLPEDSQARREYDFLVLRERSVSKRVLDAAKVLMGRKP